MSRRLGSWLLGLIMVIFMAGSFVSADAQPYRGRYRHRHYRHHRYHHRYHRRYR